MTAKEFIQKCVLTGCASRKSAEKYVKKSGKEDFSDDDLIEAYRLDEEIYSVENAVMKHGNISKDGSSTSKRYTVYNSHEG